MIRVVISVVLLSLILGACNHVGTATPKQYMAYVEDDQHELNKKIRSGNIDYTIQLVTPEYMVCKEFSHEQKIDTAVFDKRLRELKGYVYFLIKISIPVQSSVSKATSDGIAAERMVMYYQAEAAKDITLIEGKYTHAASTYLYENNYGIAPYNTIVVGFKREDADEDMELVFSDRYHNNPLLKAAFVYADIKKIPTLSIN